MKPTPAIICQRMARKASDQARPSASRCWVDQPVSCPDRIWMKALVLATISMGARMADRAISAAMPRAMARRPPKARSSAGRLSTRAAPMNLGPISRMPDRKEASMKGVNCGFRM